MPFRSRRRASLLALAVLTIAAVAGPARAQVGSERYSSIVLDAATGNVVSAVAADEPRYPASLTKIMTIYMLFEALRDRRVALDQYVPISAHAASMSPSKLGLQPGSAVTVEQLLLGLVTKSANDAAAALGELMGGDEDRFAELMTSRARALGMSHTTFRNASGLPDWDQVTTARDLATLSRHVVQDFPQQYRYFSVPSFVWHGRTIPNHDRMLASYPGADGLKTGWIEASGHNLVTSAVHGDIRLIGVVLGAGSVGERDNHMAALLDTGFDRLGAPPGPALASRLPSFIGSAQAAPIQVASIPRAERVRMRPANLRAANLRPANLRPAVLRPAVLRPALGRQEAVRPAASRVPLRPEPARATPAQRQAGRAHAVYYRPAG